LQIASSITVIQQPTQPCALWPGFMPWCSSKPAFCKPGYRSTTFYQHPSVLKTVGEALGLSSFPGAAQNAPDMAEFFSTTGNTTASTTPTLNILNPTAGSAVSSPVTVDATFTNGGTPQYMKLWVDGIAKYYNNNSTNLSYLLNLVTGTHQIVVQAYNGTLYTSSENITVGTTTTSTGACTLSTVSPSVTICSPTNNSIVGASVSVQAGSTDTGSTVWLMQVYVDGYKQYEVQSNAVNTILNMSAGTHRVTVQAYDKAGSVFKSSVYTTVP
jgi:Bacterial Ig domain